MPRGGARPGAGRKPKPLATLLLAGAFRPARHRHLLATSTRPAAVLGDGWHPTPEALAALEPAGRALGWDARRV